MYHMGVMSGPQPAGDFAHYMDGLGKLQARLLEPIVQRAAVHVLAHGIDQIAVLPGVGRADQIGMSHRGQRVRVAAKLLEATRIGQQRWRQHADDHGPLMRLIEGAIHRPQTARADRADDIVGADTSGEVRSHRVQRQRRCCRW